MVAKEYSERTDRSLKGATGSGRRARSRMTATPPLAQNLSPEASACLSAIERVSRAMRSLNDQTVKVERAKVEILGVCHSICDDLSATSFAEEEEKLRNQLDALHIPKHGSANTQHQRLIKEALKHAFRDVPTTKDARSLINKYTAAFVGMRLAEVTATNFEAKLKERAPAPPLGNGKLGLERFKAEYSKKYSRRKQVDSGTRAEGPEAVAMALLATNGHDLLNLSDKQIVAIATNILQDVERRNLLEVLLPPGVDDQEYENSQFIVENTDDGRVYISFKL